MVLCKPMVLRAGDYRHMPAEAGDELCWPDGTPMATTVDWAAIINKPSTFPPSAHTQDWTTITGKPTTFPPSAHTHAISEVTGLTAALAALPVYAFASADQTTTGATGVNITSLSFSVAANTRYVGTIQFLYQSNNILAGPAIGATGPTMAEAFTATVHAPASGGIGGILANVGSLLTITSTDVVNTDRPLTMHFKFKVGGTGGTLQFQFARGGLAGSTITSRASSTAQLFLAA